MFDFADPLSELRGSGCPGGGERSEGVPRPPQADADNERGVPDQPWGGPQPPLRVHVASHRLRTRPTVSSLLLISLLLILRAKRIFGNLNDWAGVRF